MIPPNIALLAWPLVAIWLFKTLPFERAIIWSVLVSYLFLPSSYVIDLPGLPALGKESLPNFVLLIIILSMAPVAFRWLPPSSVGKTLLIMLFGGTFLTAITNQDPIWIGGRILPGLTLYDALSDTIYAVLNILPFLIGWQYLSKTEHHRELLKAFLALGLAYSLLMLLEVRLSPQLHTWIYGYFPHTFGQQYRWGGFRPVVFLTHGLHVAFFAMTILIAAGALWRENRDTPEPPDSRPIVPYAYATGYFMVILVLCKSLGSLLYGLVFLPVVLFLKTRRQLGIAMLLVVIALSYPVMRGVHLVPTETLLGWAGSFSAEREQSLGVRFYNEEKLLEHAADRILFGWGGWGRNRVYDEQTGADDVVTDGHWAIVIGGYGWIGYLATFGLLGCPIIMLWLKARRRKMQTLPQPTTALAVLLGINMIELLPNATLQPWTWLIAGAILGNVLQNQETVEPKVSTPLPQHSRTVI